MQLTFINKLFESETKDVNMTKNILRLINNLKFLRVRFEEKMGNLKEGTKTFKAIRDADNTLGYCLYWLAVMGYQHSKHLPEYSSMTQDDWYEKTYNKGYSALYEERSIEQIYTYLKDYESLSKRFKFNYINQLEKTTTHSRLLKFYFESLNDMKTRIETIL